LSVEPRLSSHNHKFCRMPSVAHAGEKYQPQRSDMLRRMVCAMSAISLRGVLSNPPDSLRRLIAAD
jgi:hypothetical protein